MFPYTVKYDESEYDIQNNNILYIILPTCQNTFETTRFSKKSRKKKRNMSAQIKSLFHNMHKFHNSYFVIFVITQIRIPL